MAQLNQKPGTSSPSQRKKLVLAGKAKGLSVDDLRAMVGSNLHDLSAAMASYWIKQLSGQDLPNPPGKKPRPCDTKRKTPGTSRMIDADQVEQIERLLVAYFGELDDGLLWLSGNFKTPRVAGVTPDETHYAIRRLATAERAGQVIRALKLMLQRRSRDREGADKTEPRP